MTMEKIVVDSAIPYLKGVLEPYFNVKYMKGSDISPEDVADAAAIVVRTRTRCGQDLLSGSTVRLVATATIGTDHIDEKWCAANGIKVASAPGCNSGGVCQYVFAALSALGLTAFDEKGHRRTLGVVGVGHVGSKVAAEGRRRGYVVLENDPPRGLLLALDELLERSDIVTLHIPLEGNRDFADWKFFSQMKKGASFLNASRGEVVVDEDLLKSRTNLDKVVLDVWRNEPEIDRRMLAAADIATPHIAGYSIQGKANGTAAVVRSVGDFFGIRQLEDFSVSLPPAEPAAYDIMKDDRALRSSPESFEQLRNNYSYRDESIIYFQ